MYVSNAMHAGMYEKPCGKEEKGVGRLGEGILSIVPVEGTVRTWKEKLRTRNVLRKRFVLSEALTFG